MIQEYAESIPDDFKVSVATVYPWVRFPTCPKCDFSLALGVPLIRLIVLANGSLAQSYAYCAGDQDSQIRVPTLNISTGEQGIGGVKVPCFGIVHEHLHLKCARCSFRWLMNVKGGKS